MLQFLRIQNLALMDSIEMEFGPGFIAVTGETGAGKSILLGALALLSGARAEKTIIRQGEENCTVEAVIEFAEPAEVNAALAEIELPPCEGGTLVLRRVVSRSKAGRVHVNGALTTLGRLQELGTHWIDFHGPGEPQKLFSERWQLALLDRFANNEADLRLYSKDFLEWRSVLREIEILRSAEQLSADEREFLQTQIAAIDEASLSEEGVQELERDHARLIGAQELIESAVAVANVLGSDEGISAQLRAALVAAREASAIDPAIQELSDRLESIIIEAEDLSTEFQSVADDADIDAETAASIEERMESWLQLKRKYGGDVPRILEKRGQLADRLNRQGDIEGTVQRMTVQAEGLKAKLEVRAETIRKARLRASKELAKASVALLGHLGFAKARFSIEIEREPELREYGNCGASFRFAPNAGQDFLPLNKIASSGELARVMLALKAVLAQVDATPVLVFDEVDANVGGEIARAVGTELGKLGEAHQIFCVTHLPQVACTAKSHFVVRKAQTEDASSVKILPVHDSIDDRLEELARMLGDRTSPIARQHAQALLGVVPRPATSPLGDVG